MDKYLYVLLFFLTFDFLNGIIMMKNIILSLLFATLFCLISEAQGISFVEGKTLSEVLAQAKNEGKLVFVDCYTEWCGPCKMMARTGGG